MRPADPVSLRSRPRYHSKIVAGLLALLLGWAGIQRWYLGRPHAWRLTALSLALLLASQTLFDSRWDNPAFLALVLPAAAGFIDGLRLGLMADDTFNARYNPGLTPRAQMGWPVVLIAVATFLIGSVVTVAGIAMITVYVWTAMGWLDGYTF